MLGTDGAGGQDGLRRIERPSSASRSDGECRTIATSDTGSSDPRTLPGAPRATFADVAEAGQPFVSGNALRVETIPLRTM